MVDDEIIVIRPGSFCSRHLLQAREIASVTRQRISMTAAEFLAEAWRLANDKARELGWIV